MPFTALRPQPEDPNGWMAKGFARDTPDRTIDLGLGACCIHAVPNNRMHMAEMMEEQINMDIESLATRT